MHCCRWRHWDPLWGVTTKDDGTADKLSDFKDFSKMWSIYIECAKLGISNGPPKNWWDDILPRVKGEKAHARARACTHAHTHARTHAREQGGMAIEKQKETTAARRQSAGKDRTPRT